MASSEYVATPKPVPALNIPPSNNTCTLRIINSTAVGSGPIELILTPHIAGHDRLKFPCFSFLIQQESKDGAKGKNVLFDIGIRKDYWNLAPSVASRLTGDKPLFEVTVEKNVADILDEGAVGITSKDIDAVVFSHHHWDHIGDMTTFPPSTSLILGPGFQSTYLPGFPRNPDSALLEADFTNRPIHELPASAFSSLTLGRFPAHDYFGDGSFYLLSAPGHTVGHLCGLVRTTPDTFVFLGGDACHHGGEFRPTEFLPLPTAISLLGGSSRSVRSSCPGAWLVENIHPQKSGTEPFYDIAAGFSHDHDEAKECIGKLQEFDASEDVLVVIAHDGSMLPGEEEKGDGGDGGGKVAFYPETINDWKAKGVQLDVRWAFVRDFDLSGAP